MQRYGIFMTICRAPYSPSAFFPSGASPLPTAPLSLRSICQLSVAPDSFLSVKAKIACPFVTASCRSALSDSRALLISSKAWEEGKDSSHERTLAPAPSRQYCAVSIPFLSDMISTQCVC